MAGDKWDSSGAVTLDAAAAGVAAGDAAAAGLTEEGRPHCHTEEGRPPLPNPPLPHPPLPHPQPDHTEKPVLEVLGLAFGYGKRAVLRDVSFTAQAGDLVALLGPNGVGKSTLMRCILGFETGFAGMVRVCGHDAKTLSARRLAQLAAYIPQSSAQVFDFTVLELVLMGAAPRLGLLQNPGAAEREEAMAVLESLAIAHLAHRGCGQVSGGEYQLALLARALLQKARILMMDEPTASLDYGNQYRVMERISALASRDFIVLFSAHDPNQVLRHANRALVLEGGRLTADGHPMDVMTPQALSALYGIDVARFIVGDGYQLQVPVCVPMGGGNALAGEALAANLQPPASSENIHGRGRRTDAR